MIRLRKLRPLAERPPDRDGDPPWTPCRATCASAGSRCRSTAILGGLGTFAAFVVAMVLDPVILATGGGWMIAGMLLYVAYRRHQGLPLSETVKVETLTPLGVEEVEYKSILVAFDDDDPFSSETVATAKALAARAGGGRSTCSRWSPCPPNLPLDAALERARARRADEDRAGEADLRPAGQRPHRARAPGQAGQAIIEEAQAIEAAAIVMPLRYRNGAPLYGKTLQTVLAKRPCRVIVAAHPSEQADRVAVPRMLRRRVPGLMAAPPRRRGLPRGHPAVRR